MLAGIPGTGVSVFFYLLSVCAILLTELVNRARQRGDNAKRRVAWLQLKILVGGALTIGLTMWGYGYLISELAGVIVPLFNPLVRLHSPLHAALIGPCVMLAVIASVEIASFVCRHSAKRTIHELEERIVVAKFADDEYAVDHDLAF